MTVVLGRWTEKLQKTRERLGARLRQVMGHPAGTGEEFFDQLEEVLLEADLGPGPVGELLETLREQVRAGQLQSASQVIMQARDSLAAFFPASSWEEKAGEPLVLLLVGVNGVGKTTTLAKLAWRWQQQGRMPMLAAGDTFRAAAIEQLQIWGERLQVPVIAHEAGGDPGAVVFDALQAMHARQRDVLLVDTAGRLHTRHNLMEELKKIHRIVQRERREASLCSVLVLDATTGQNALNQARVFHQAISLDGLILTKLDGTARGGIALAVSRELGLPIAYVGLGERMEDLVPFQSQEFVSALFPSDLTPSS